MTGQPVERVPVDRRRVRVWFGEHLLHDYLAEATAAERYAESIGRRFAGLEITVDLEVSEDLSPLPCEQLWSVLTP